MAPLPAPLVRHVATPAWTIHARAERGEVRRTMQDTFAVLADAPCSWMRCDAIAVFDGVGGMPNGAEAARAAAEGLPDAIRNAKALPEVLHGLQDAVLATRGAATAVVALLPRDGGDLQVVWSGDSAAYVLDAGHGILPIAAADSEEGMLTRCLGLEGMEPHVLRTRVPVGQAVLLCTDGVDGVVGRLPLQVLLEGPAAADARQLDLLLAAVAKAGAPDNATAVLARRRA